MKKIVLLMGLIFVSPAMANSSHEWHVAKNALCEVVGEMSVKAFEAKVADVPQEAVFTNVTHVWARKAIDYGYQEADSIRNAYVNGWAKCMNKLGSMYDRWVPPLRGDHN